MRSPFTNYVIKLLAALLMVIDHVGVVFFPSDYAFRAIGRLSFPLFAWLLTQGEEHTHNIRRYGTRLLLLGAISQPIYQLTFEVSQLNILFTLLLGVVVLRLARRFPDAQVLIWLGAGALAELANLEYGLYGIGAIALLRFYRHSLFWLAWGGWHLLFLVAAPEFGQFQLPAIAAPLLLRLTNRQAGAKARWFYLFYPTHLAILYLIHQGWVPFPSG